MAVAGVLTPTATAKATATDGFTPGVRGDEAVKRGEGEGEEDAVFENFHGVAGELPMMLLLLLLLLLAAVPPVVLKPDAELGLGLGCEGGGRADCIRASSSSLKCSG